MNRATGVVSQYACPKKQNIEGTFRNIGSGSLTSTTRFTTALHVLNNENAGHSIEVIFGTANIRRNYWNHGASLSYFF